MYFFTSYINYSKKESNNMECIFVLLIAVSVMTVSSSYNCTSRD